MHSKIIVPSLLIWGTKDGALDKQMAERSRKYVNDLTVSYIEGASHWVQQDEPEQFNALMRQFLHD
jgi:pimeloyl-ACP methyl ester carboxylesterase